MKIECFVDTDFTGGWDKGNAQNSENILSRTDYAIFYAGYPVLCCSKLQKEIVLSMAESEYIALSTALLGVIPFMNLLQEMTFVFKLHLTQP